MDQVVIEASVAVKWFVVEPYSNEARRVLDTYQSGKASFHAPDMARRGQGCRREGDGEHSTRLPTIAFALAAMKDSLVGASTERLRARAPRLRKLSC